MAQGPLGSSLFSFDLPGSMAFLKFVLVSCFPLAAGNSLHVASICRNLSCDSKSHPLLDYDPVKKECLCRAHPCWSDANMVHTCPKPEAPFLNFYYTETGQLVCECATAPHYETPYMTKTKCPGQRCRDAEYPVLDFDDYTKECVCRAHPCWDLNGLQHKCKNDKFPVLRYREEEKDGTINRFCECVTKMNHPGMDEL
mmetsp:Transcript_97085/g.231017  ORF Transcript_97085/g.231017 Transcript_97085/m.231017 type:complete len:198 (+) Transcript_97085:10-603(+)